jgi:DNA-directed RNA polymerase specialized sigma24 family protein
LEVEHVTQNEVKDMLSSAMAAYRRYKTKYDELEVFRQQLAVKPLGGGDGAGSSTKLNSTELGYIQLIALEDKQSTLYTEWLLARDRVADIINKCPVEKAAAVLTYRYLNGAKFEDIAEALGLGVRHVFRLHKSGIKTLSVILGNDVIECQYDI